MFNTKTLVVLFIPKSVMSEVHVPLVGFQLSECPIAGDEGAGFRDSERETTGYEP